jgi:hypothetical protein
MGFEIDFFLNCLQESILSIPRQYFMIPRHENDAVLRERAYCYELYHQLRLRLGDDFPYTLHGEIDKRGSAFFEQVFLGHPPNPDFVVHRPGTMDNLIAIEVKPSRCSRQQAIEDLEKLRRFVSEVDYQIGIFIVFGPGWNPDLQIPDPRIQIYWHSEVNTPPEIFKARN